MENKEITPKMQRQRKFMLALPVLVLPFLTLIFWALGGGKMEAADAKATVKAGFNLNLPDANLKEDKAMDKMSYYDMAMQDSTKLKAQEKSDPNFKKMEGTAAVGNPYGAGGLNTSLSSNGSPNDPNTENIYRKLELLGKELNKPVAPTAARSDYSPAPRPGTSVGTADVDRLEKMMQSMSQPDTEDPEIKQLNAMLEKVLDVQHPERVKERLKENAQSQKTQALSVSAGKGNEEASLLDNTVAVQASTNGFYSLDDSTAAEAAQNAIPAVVHETQTLVSGSIVKLRLQSDIHVSGVLIPKDSFIFGIASLSGERLSIEITNLRYGNSLFPVDLAVFDMDGLDGIHIPGAITRDVAAQSADRSVQGIGLTSLDPTWQAQAASAGVETAKTLFSKKVKLIKVTVKAGYQVLLRDGKQKQATIELTK
ncbi:conjugative transposon protein TraM [Flavobacterium zepuense]|uniref:Conjugative transposon protein TraM n=1 Tax=Flavobacterium zepuense TaxID=2593302 RepID=A0A552V191_9FLAO|nr:conjugative transposon protein TraM [Flavobacterium zepuense]TRW24225.1 conjugative transposon protein TraM [Flavobacterium zepuense]